MKQKKGVLKVKTLDVPLFGGSVILCRSVKEWYVTMEAFGDTEPVMPNMSGMHAKIMSRSTGEVWKVVGVFDGKIPTLAHEISHACFAILHEHGVPTPAGEANETFCYLMTRLMDQALKAFRKGELK